MDLFKNDSEAAGYLAAMIDGEGCVSVRPKTETRSVGRSVEIANTEQSIIDATVAACARLGIECRVVCYERTSKWKPVYRVLITGRKNYELLREKVPLRSALKSARLDDALAAYVIKPPQPSGEELRRWYCDEGRSARDIADAIGRPLQTVYAWMRKAGIERRGKSEALAIAWATGRKSDWRSGSN